MNIRTNTRNKNNAWIPGWRLRIDQFLVRIDTPFGAFFFDPRAKFGPIAQIELGPRKKRERRDNIYSRSIGIRFNGFNSELYRYECVCMDTYESFTEMVEYMVENHVVQTGKIQGANPSIDFSQLLLIESMKRQEAEAKSKPPGPNHRPILVISDKVPVSESPKGIQ